MADHSVFAWNELYESEASWALVFCFDKLPQKSLASFAILTGLFRYVYEYATRRE